MKKDKSRLEEHNHQHSGMDSNHGNIQGWIVLKPMETF